MLLMRIMLINKSFWNISVQDWCKILGYWTAAFVEKKMSYCTKERACSGTSVMDLPSASGALWRSKLSLSVLGLINLCAGDDAWVTVWSTQPYLERLGFLWQSLDCEHQEKVSNDLSNRKLLLWKQKCFYFCHRDVGSVILEVSHPYVTSMEISSLSANILGESKCPE